LHENIPSQGLKLKTTGTMNSIPPTLPPCFAVQEKLIPSTPGGRANIRATRPF